MSDQATRLPVGFRLCTNPGCGATVHYKKAMCQVCSAVQIRVVAEATAAPPIANVVVHPSAPAAVVFEPYVVMQDFKCLLGNVVGEFKRTMVLTDHAQIEQLKAAAAPICPVSQANGLACCPNCKTVFPLPGNGTEKKRAG